MHDTALMHPTDSFGRPLGNLRVSVVDRCNLRCQYCMPEAEYTWLPKADILTFEEISTVVDAFTGLGVRKVRLTGGEPLVRRDLPVLVHMLAAKEAIDELAMTTNGVLLEPLAAPLRRAGLQRLTVSLDTLQRDRYLRLAQRDALDATLAGIEAARSVGFTDIKLDTVVLRGENDDELVDMVRFAKSIGAEVRFIEYMDVGGATQWSPDQVVSRREILGAIEAALGPSVPCPGRGPAPAERFQLADGTVFGIIASTTQPFCAACDRSRITADGMWYRCLYAADGTDLRALLRSGASAEDLQHVLANGWRRRRDRGAEERARLRARSPLFAAPELKERPHLEMHTRGG